MVHKKVKTQRFYKTAGYIITSRDWHENKLVGNDLIKKSKVPNVNTLNTLSWMTSVNHGNIASKQIVILSSSTTPITSTFMELWEMIKHKICTLNN